MTTPADTDHCQACYCSRAGCEARLDASYGRCCRSCTHPVPPWPPPPTPSDVWETVPVMDAGTITRRRLRRVQLWGQPVLIDEAALVWCRRCYELLTPARASAPEEPHTIALPAHTYNQGGQP